MPMLRGQRPSLPVAKPYHRYGISSGGDRYGEMEDPFGFVWAIATHLEDLTAEEIEARRKKAFGGGAASQA
jgi:hypothetical protein